MERESRSARDLRTEDELTEEEESLQRNRQPIGRREALLRPLDLIATHR